MFCFGLWAAYELTTLRARCKGKHSGVKGPLRSLHLGRDFAKGWIIFQVYFCSERKPQASEYWLPSLTPNSCQAMKGTSETTPLDPGWVRGEMGAFGWLLCLFPTQCSFILAFLSSKDTVCSPLTPDHPKTQVQVRFLKTNDWGLVLYFCFLPAIVYLRQQKWVYSFIFKNLL